MARVYVTTYEVIGAGEAIADQHYAKVNEAKDAHWQFVKSVGGVGYRPDHNGGLRSVFFAEMPKGWRKSGGSGAKIEAIPRKGSKAGEALIAAIGGLLRAPTPGELAAALGFAPKEWAFCDSGVIYFPTELRVEFPAKRSFVRLPRSAGDGYEPDETMLRALPESELMKALEDHNEVVRQRKAALATQPTDQVQP